MSSIIGINPIFPKCYDCNRCSTKEKTILFGLARGIVSIVSLALSITFLTSKTLDDVFEENQNIGKTSHSISVVICTENVLHCIVSVIIILLARSNIDKPRSIKIWLIIDLTLCTVLVLCILIFLFTFPWRKLYLVVGTALMISSVFLSYRSSVTYVIYKSDEDSF